MAFSTPLLLLVALAVTALATPSGTGSHIVHGARDSVPRGWSPQRRADPDAILPLKFALVQSNLDNLEAYLLDISDPLSPNYGQYWSSSKVAETFRPSEESVDSVRSWLVDDLGVAPDKVQLNRNRDTVMLNATVSEAEDILRAEYFVYNYGNDGTERIGCHGGYSLPEHVSKHVDFVSPTVHFRQPLRRRGTSPSTEFGPVIKQKVSDPSTLEASGCDQAVTLDCLRDLYDFNYTPVAGNNNSVAVLEILGAFYNDTDLDTFFQRYAPSLVGHAPTLVSIEGGSLDGNGEVLESNLDMELLMGLLGPNQQVSLYEVGTTSNVQIPMDQLLAALDSAYCEIDGVNEEQLEDCGDVPLANVISISYHLDPDYLDPTVSPVIHRECTEMGKLSLTGITFIASSGDGGVGYSQSQYCLVNGTLTPFADSGSFVGEFPESCPYATAVGATSVAPGNSVTEPEIATTAFPSGGGFSYNFRRQSWQDDVVTHYLDNYSPSYNSDIFNRSGRAWPDVAANGWPTVIVSEGDTILTGGTSASAPIFAAMITAINDARIAAGKGPLGFLNPSLYSSLLADAYNDVTNGTNPGCGTEGFVAAPGWDPVTGLGTPNFPKMMTALLSLP